MSYRKNNAATNELFTQAYEKTTDAIEFKREWSNGAVGYDYAVYGDHAPRIPAGKMVKSASPNGRRLLFIGTRVGNLVIYDRFAKQGKGEEGYEIAVFMRNTVSVIENLGFFHDIAFDEYEMGIAVGDGQRDHLGINLENLWSAMRKASTPAQVPEIMAK